MSKEAKLTVRLTDDTWTIGDDTNTCLAHGTFDEDSETVVSLSSINEDLALLLVEAACNGEI